MQPHLASGTEPWSGPTEGDPVPLVLAVAGAAGIFVGLLAAAEAAASRFGVVPEHARKFAHIAAALVAATLPWWMPFPALRLLAAAFVPFMVISRRRDLFPAIHAVERSTWGDVYFPLGVLGATCFPAHLPYAFGVLVMGLGDAAASLVGRRFGRRAYRVASATKTYMGSAALFATTFVLAAGACALSGVAVPACLLVAAGIAIPLTLAEGVLGGGTDNLVLPALAAGLLSLTREIV
jgi:phytol kinase